MSLDRRRVSSGLAVLAVGLVVAGAAWAGSGARTGLALATVFLVFAVAQVLWSSRSDGDVAALVGGTGDERQRGIDVRATAVAGLAMGTFSLGMAIAALARDDDNPWLLVCLVGGLTYVIALGWFRARS